VRLRLLATPALIVLIPAVAFAQDDLPRLGVGVKASTLGIGIEAAAGVTSRSNVRGSFNFFDYNKAFHSDGIAYSSRLKLRSVQIMYDHYIVGGFHVSPGILMHNGNRGLATASVPATQKFSLGGVTYFSNATNPVSGEATLDFRNVAPIVLAGFGNLLPSSDRHFGVNFDAGVAFQGSPNLKLDLRGTACATSPTTTCVNVETDPLVQDQVRVEENDLIEDAKAFRYYPIVSIGVSWKF
jgi:hypothetical protein